MDCDGWIPHGSESDAVGEIRIVWQQRKEEELGVRVHRNALRMDTRAQTGSGSGIEQQQRLPPQDHHQHRIQLHLLQFLQQPLLLRKPISSNNSIQQSFWMDVVDVVDVVDVYLFAGLFLRVEAGGHDPLLAETDEGCLHGQCQVRFVAIPRSWHRYVVVPRWCCCALLLRVQTNRIYNNNSNNNNNINYLCIHLKDFGRIFDGFDGISK